MSLVDFLGSTSEIKIIDFLAENMDMAYNQTEISECLGISRTVVNQKIPVLMYNKIIEIKECKGNKKIWIKRKQSGKQIISAIYEHSFKWQSTKKRKMSYYKNIGKCQTAHDEKCDCCGELVT